MIKMSIKKPKIYGGFCCYTCKNYYMTDGCGRCSEIHPVYFLDDKMPLETCCCFEQGKILHLNLINEGKQNWFTQIAEGTKKIEYRDYTPYWISRLCEDFAFDNITFKDFRYILFKNGMNTKNRKAPEMLVRCGEIELVDTFDKKTETYGYRFEIELGEIIYIKNYEGKIK